MFIFDLRCQNKVVKFLRKPFVVLFYGTRIQEITCKHLSLMRVTHMLHVFNNELIVGLYCIYS